MIRTGAPAKKAIHDVVICGGGHNGLVAAAYLARAGLGVIVLERRHLVGGACVTEEIFSGFKVSTCAYILHNLADRVVADLELRRHGLRVFEPVPSSVSIVGQRRALIDWGSRGRTDAEVRRLSERDVAGLRQWDQLMRRVGKLFYSYAAEVPPTLDALLEDTQGTEDGAALLKLASSSASELLDEYFESEEIKAAILAREFDLPVDEQGAPLAAASLHPEWFVDPANQGIVEGGMGSVTQAILTAALHAGARVRVGAEVERILFSEGRAAGVELTDGQTILADAVISNADPKRTFLSLVRRDDLDPELGAEVAGLDTRTSCAKFHAAVSELPDFSNLFGRDFEPHLAAIVRLCPTRETYWRAGAAAAGGQLPEEPVLNVQIPTVYDRTVAPDGQHIVSLWCRFFPPRPPSGTWDDHRTEIGERLIDQLDSYAPNFRRSLLDWCVYTPGDLEERIYLTDGNIRHTDVTSRQLLGDRLFQDGGHRTPVQSLYMCGVGTHPAGEVSGMPGFNAARVVLEDLELTPRPR